MAIYSPTLLEVTQFFTSQLTDLTHTGDSFIKDGSFGTFASGSILAHQPNQFLSGGRIRWAVGQFTTLPATDAQVELRGRVRLTTGGTSADRAGYCRILSDLGDITEHAGFFETNWFGANVGPSAQFDFVISTLFGAPLTGNSLRSHQWHSDGNTHFWLELKLNQFTQQPAQGTDGSTATIEAVELWISDIGPRPARQVISV